MRKKRSYQPERAVVYGRQSRTMTGSQSREDQVAVCVAEAERIGVEVVEVILEPPSTGAYKGRGRNRPEWPRLLELVRLRKVDCVVALKTDRLSRGGGPGWAPLLEAADDAGLDTDRLVLIVGSGFMTEFEIGIRATMDREESRKTSDRITINKERNAMEGKFHGGRRPYGYAADGMTVIDDEADEIRSLARRHLAGESLGSLATELNQRGVPTAAGRTWTTTGVRLVLSSPRVAGLRQYGYEIDSDGKPDVRRPIIVGDATWPAILDRDDWARLGNKFMGNANYRPKASKYLLTGIARCHKCGNGLNGVHFNRYGGRKARNYWCAKQPNGVGCAGVAIPADSLDDHITAAVIAMANNEKFMARLRRNAGDADTIARSKATKELVAAEANLEQLEESFADGEISRESWRKIAPRAEKRRDAARDRLGRLAVAVRVLPKQLDRPDELEEEWALMTIGERVAVLDAMIDRVVIGPGVVGRHAPDPAARSKIEWKT